MENGMTLEQFRQARESGVDLYADTGGADAAHQQDEGEYGSDQDETELPEHTEQETEENDDLSSDNDQDDQIPSDQKNAFYKRVQRERKKAEQEAEERIKAEYESQLNPYKAFFDSVGLSPEQAMYQVEQNRINQEAQQLAYQNGWDEQQTQFYMRQQQLERQQQENVVALKVYELADTADYPNIKQMKGQITEFIRANPRATVEAAYWAVGGPSLAQQLKREAEQREIVKRTQARRTVVSGDSPAATGPAPLPPEAVKFMRETGTSEKVVRAMLNDEIPNDLASYRKWKNKK